MRVEFIKYGPYITILALLGAWQTLPPLLNVPQWLLPLPAAVFDSTASWSSTLPLHIGTTLFETVGGFLLSLLFGIPLAMLIVYSPIVQSSVYPVLVLFNSIPKISIAPLFLLWVGYGTGSKVLMAFLLGFFPIVIDTAAGLRNVPNELVDMARSLRVAPIKIFLTIRLPWALPYVFSGMKVAIGLALIGAIIGEFVGSDIGLGYLILVGTGNMDTGLVFGAIAILGLMGVLLFGAIDLLERRLCPWYVDSTVEVHASA